ncbi:hypothetical protein BHR43_13380 [Aeromonas salmonicida subsp. salmonicida]|nr:hypothetical protein AXW81_20460 [Aeromonas salmonicida subsp. salmonicida]OKA76848.1 hypothetical protein BHR41_11290 [Aeromonas salmonicida subsp. salmonicida]OKA80850.1 hypothetical protein BHR40_09445 [Aeromonas salmonicida subsp. salmonicida]OKA81926.1 hypothetical protein BHR42_07755 [Aeromonas salmonicida subsp. salmonicida]OKA85600.1 hypothetical protein BHR44_09095 [Aeromonas salmonicida subsp. salmonicida]
MDPVILYRHRQAGIGQHVEPPIRPEFKQQDRQQAQPQQHPEQHIGQTRIGKGHIGSTRLGALTPYPEIRTPGSRGYYTRQHRRHTVFLQPGTGRQTRTNSGIRRSRTVPGGRPQVGAPESHAVANQIVNLRIEHSMP